MKELVTERIQAMAIIAHRFPREREKVEAAILQECTDEWFADLAEYPERAIRGNRKPKIRPSIRLMEMVAMKSKNLLYGFRILDMNLDKKESYCEAYCWDLETNSQQLDEFTVPHYIDIRDEPPRLLTQTREIREAVTNVCKRRLRTCIESVVPRGLVYKAVMQCRQTMLNLGGAGKEQVKALFEAFESEFGVDKRQIARFLGHSAANVNNAEIITLRQIYAALRDGMAEVDQYFDIPGQAVVPVGGGQIIDYQQTVHQGPVVLWDEAAQNWRCGDEWFDHEKHGMSKDGQPSITLSGRFRAKRKDAGTVVPETPEQPPVEEQTPPIESVDPAQADIDAIKEF